MKTLNSSRDAQAELYPIRTVATLTGVNPITLRAWERRYGLIKPKRTQKGHRLYTQEDIDLIHHVVTQLDKGVSISQIRTGALPTVNDSRAVDVDSSSWQRYLSRMLAAIVRFDEEALEATYNEALSLYPVDIVSRRLLLPLLKTLGERWELAEGSVAEEHFFGVYLRNKLGARFHHRPSHQSGPKLLAACLPGERHELGLLLFALAASERGFRLILLGADMPLADLPVAAKRSHSDAIVLSGSTVLATELLEQDLAALTATTPVPVFLGGLTSVRWRDAVVRARATPLGDDVEAGLRQLMVHLQLPGNS